MTLQAIADTVRVDMTLPKREFARRLRIARDAADLTQAQVAKQIGVDWATYQRWESARTSPRPGKIEPLARALQVDVEHLRGSEEDTDTALERLVAQGEATARALRELRVALDGIDGGRLDRISDLIVETNHREKSIEAAFKQHATWTHQVEQPEKRLTEGLAALREGQAVPPQSD